MVHIKATLGGIHQADIDIGVTRRRLVLASTATGLLALGILLAGALVAFPASRSLATPLIQLVAILSGLSYYVAFAPPHWLRQTWQLEELYRFLRETAGRSAEDRAPAVLEHIRLAASRAVGGTRTLLARWDESEHRWIPWSNEDELFLSVVLNDQAELIQRAESLHKGFVVRTLWSIYLLRQPESMHSSTPIEPRVFPITHGSKPMSGLSNLYIPSTQQFISTV